MLTLRRILIPTDFAPCADRAFAHASFLAARHDAELHVLHLTPVTGVDAARPHECPVPDGVRRVDVTRQSLSVPDDIARYARDVDLVVMGTHGRRGTQRTVLGSTTEQVIRRADCPVLAVGLDAERATPVALDRLLVPVDFSDSSAPALAMADALAQLYDATVDVLHAVFVPDLPDVYGLGVHLEGTFPDIVDRSREALTALVHTHVAPERRGDVVIRVGPPAETILEQADRLASGLLVLPTHGRTGLQRLSFGSVTESVLRRAPCAVFALKSFDRMPLSDTVERPTATTSYALDQALADVLANHDV